MSKSIKNITIKKNTKYRLLKLVVLFVFLFFGKSILTLTNATSNTVISSSKKVDHFKITSIHTGFEETESLIELDLDNPSEDFINVDDLVAFFSSRYQLKNSIDNRFCKGNLFFKQLYILYCNLKLSF